MSVYQHAFPGHMYVHALVVGAVTVGFVITVGLLMERHHDPDLILGSLAA